MMTSRLRSLVLTCLTVFAVCALVTEPAFADHRPGHSRGGGGGGGGGPGGGGGGNGGEPPAPGELEIAYVDRSSNRDRLMLMTPDGAGKAEVLQVPHRHDWIGRVAWSPDGTRIAWIGSFNRTRGLYKVGVDGSNLTQVLPLNDVSVWRVDWSIVPTPDGTDKIAFRATSEGHNRIFIVNTDGTGLLEIPANPDLGDGLEPLGDTNMAWHPGGGLTITRLFWDDYGNLITFTTLMEFALDGNDLVIADETVLIESNPDSLIGEGPLDLSWANKSNWMIGDFYVNDQPALQVVDFDAEPVEFWTAREGFGIIGDYGFSPDDTQVVYIGTSGQIRILNLDDGSEDVIVDGNANSVRWRRNADPQ